MPAQAHPADLDAVEVIEQPHDQVIMDALDIKGDDSQPVTDIVGQDFQPGNGIQSGECPLQQFFLPAAYPGGSHLFLEGNAKGCFDGLEKARGSSVFTCLDVVDILVVAQGLVQSTVPPPGWSGTSLWYMEESKMRTPGEPGPPETYGERT